ncbi:AraC family transcriptional regulator [Streptomyces montanus]|uniref:AraC family transcriptional regulator n=1 Tax=Streptomyces montanus TaxID=2580423 RepID=A0A5R9FNS6_9ACTN|nr:helix-turn-helix domain-containing protein [Streptomyces montanus]TLS44991.1 AraC family transcriptional regulator [Streptomyces montanus]
MSGAFVDEAVRAAPAPPLRGLVGWYSGYRQRGVPHAQHRGLPSPWLTLILTLDEPLSMAAHPDPGAAPGDYPTLLGGLHLTPALIDIPGRQSGIQVAISPLGARILLGLPAGELTGIDVHADDVLGAGVREVHDRLHDATDWAARFRVVDNWLLRRMSDHEGLRATSAVPIAHAWQRLLSAGGRLRVGKLAADIGFSERHLRNRFREEIGLTPKAAARVIRFDLARRRLATLPHSRLRSIGGTLTGLPDLAGLAADHGYADQSHLDREFNALASCTPSAWLAQEFRNIQSGHHPPA